MMNAAFGANCTSQAAGGAPVRNSSGVSRIAGIASCAESRGRQSMLITSSLYPIPSCRTCESSSADRSNRYAAHAIQSKASQSVEGKRTSKDAGTMGLPWTQITGVTDDETMRC